MFMTHKKTSVTIDDAAQTPLTVPVVGWVGVCGCWHGGVGHAGNASFINPYTAICHLIFFHPVYISHYKFHHLWDVWQSVLCCMSW